MARNFIVIVLEGLLLADDLKTPKSLGAVAEFPKDD